MKTIQLLLVLSINFLFFNCQSEENEIITETPPTQLIVTGSPLVKLISRTTQNPTSKDNVLDNSSCFSVKLPVEVFVNGTTITVNSEADYQTVQNAIDAFSNDDDIVNFNFPITVQFQNSTSQIIEDTDELDDVLDDCDENDDFDEIDCIAINYPVVINVYNTNNQVANTISITSNTQFFNYLDSIDSDDIATIVFPLTMINSNNQSVLINSNKELEDFIEDAIDDCDDDDSEEPSPAFASILTSGSWYVSYYFEEVDDETIDYDGYNFTFNSNLSISVSKNSDNSSGSWLNFSESGDTMLDLDFSDSNLSKLADDWKIIEYNENQIRLKHIDDGDDDDNAYLNLSKR